MIRLIFPYLDFQKTLGQPKVKGLQRRQRRGAYLLSLLQQVSHLCQGVSYSVIREVGQAMVVFMVAYERRVDRSVSII